jgi:hypothetical protein
MVGEGIRRMCGASREQRAGTGLPKEVLRPAWAVMSDAPVATTSAALAIGLQEWAVCCRALGEGRIILVVRKGGIHERGGGLFRLEHERFALLPTHLHQDTGRLLPAYGGRYLAGAGAVDPGRIPVALWAEAARIWKVDALARVQALGEHLMWTADELAARFRYRDQPWLYVIALRVHRLPAIQDIPDLPAYAGCRSWIPLQDAITPAGSTPALDDAAFAARLAAVAAILDRNP